MDHVLSTNPRVVYISTYVPHKCGLATFTRDLISAINLLNPERPAEVIALDDPASEQLSYPAEVVKRIRQNFWPDYERALRHLNFSSVDLVVIQHEFGIWGDADGEFVVGFLEKLKKPCVVVFHTVLAHPTTHQREIMNFLCQRASTVVVMLQAAADLLQREYGVARIKVAVIHHGVPDFSRQSAETFKAQLNLSGRVVMSNINLLSPSKGIEYVIRALPPVVAAYPTLLYLVIGETHPVVRSHEGERYRVQLEALAHELKLEASVQFIGRYLPLDELIRYVQASDFYVTPYLNPEQAASGSLAYAIGAGKVCLSTPYFYAREMLRRGRGVLVPFRSSGAITQALLDLLAHPDKRLSIERRAYAEGRLMTWPRIALYYLELFQSVLEYKPEFSSTSVPKPSMDYIRKLTTRWGILEHGALRIPNEAEGYTIDDNAKALIVTLAHGDRSLIRRYLAFLCQAERGGLLYNDRSANGTWQGEAGIGDWWGKALWALGNLLRMQLSTLLVKQGRQLFSQLYPRVPELHSPRAIAYATLGLAMLAGNPVLGGLTAATLDDTIGGLTAKLKALFQEQAREEWRWFEPSLTYDNARLPQALLAAARCSVDQQAKAVGLQSLDWLLSQTFDPTRNCFSFVGCNGWYPRGGSRATFDQQPVEAGATVEACVMAYQLTGAERYRQLAEQAFAWYHGSNVLYQSLVDVRAGAVFDGLTPQGVNRNRGAEAVLSYHLAHLALQRLPRSITNATRSL